ncbi:nuclear transport factor 2 family protein [Coralloluteibacterium thermophilus]|uniref:Nuclear transport factor 2 family protein n=1 Tax=Coralloluteibacterium thermophilum TaxID=2707049 RepID=A0ABV9NK88_9GAMM
MLLATLAGCAGDPTEAALRARLEAMRAAIEARDAGALLAPVAEDFAGRDGMDRRGLGRLARLHFLRHGDIGTTVGPVRVEVQGTRATARFEAAVTGGSGRLLPDTARLYAVTTGWRFEDGDWMLISADWEARL